MKRPKIRKKPWVVIALLTHFFLMPKAGNITTDYGKICQGREISKVVASCISKEFIKKYLSSSFFIVFEVTLSGTTKKKI